MVNLQILTPDDLGVGDELVPNVVEVVSVHTQEHVEYKGAVYEDIPPENELVGRRLQFECDTPRNPHYYVHQQHELNQVVHERCLRSRVLQATPFLHVREEVWVHI
jgi:hypothetical protein